MELEEYAQAQLSISAALAALVARVLYPFRFIPLLDRDWISILASIYPSVERARKESAELARRFYDDQRQEHWPSRDRHDTYLANYKFEWFVEAMQPAKAKMLQPGAGESAVSEATLRAVKEVENGGRRTLIQAVETERYAVGWARVATGRETCGFCMMLVSRGAVFTSAEDAGLDLDDTSAIQLLKKVDAGDEDAQAELDELMNRWHIGCDCKVVPVFDRKNWPGREEYLRAKALWKEFVKDKGYTGQEAVNAFRRAVESGEVDISTIAAAA